jgi:predicted acylesterase/phospholipase RssA
MKKALVISGGGSKGAWAFGFLSQKLKFNFNYINEYDYYVGTSAGALVSTAIAVDKLNIASELFKSLSNKDIYKVCPFKIKSKKGVGEYDYSFNILNILFNFYIRNQATFGDSTKAIDLIKKIYTETDHNILKKSKKELIVSVVDINTQTSKFISNRDYDYETFVKFIFASTCAAPIMSMIEINGTQYVDGGLLESVPINAVIDKEDITEIDVLNLNTNYSKSVWIDNPLKFISTYFDVFLNQSNIDDIIIGQLKATMKNIKIKIFQPSKKLTDAPFIFDPDDLKEFYKIGESDALALEIGNMSFKEFSFDVNNYSFSFKNKTNDA